MRRTILISFVLLFSFLFSFPVLAADEPDARAMLVLDASGSMWGQVEGKNKIVIAREVLADMMKDWDEDVHLGLSAYGHNRKGDCKDIETLVKVGPKTGKKIVKTVNDINPKGKTPLTAAVKKAAEELKYTEEAATVILLSDGKETCDLDPCKVGASLEEQGVDFTAHVIGFDVKIEDQAGLKCLAENTGGKFMAAENAGQLGEALAAIAEEVRSGADTVYVIFDKSGERYEKDVRWDVYAIDESGEPTDQLLYSTIKKKFLKIKQPPGRYYVKVRVGQSVYGGQVIEVKEDETQEHDIDIRGETFNLKAYLAENNPAKGDVYWRAYPLKDDGSIGKKMYNSIGHEVVAELPPGKFRISGQFHGALTYIDVESRPGEVRDLNVNFEAGTLQITPLSGGEIVKDDVFWNAYPLDGAGAEGEKQDNVVAKGIGEFILNEGRYRIKASLRGHKEQSFDIDVRQGETIEHTVSFEKK